MNDDNDSVKLKGITFAIIDCEHKTAPTQSYGIPSIRTTDIKNGFLDIKNANKVTEETYLEWTKRLKPQPGDIIVSREAPVGEVGIIPPNTIVCLGQRTVLIRPDPKQIVPRYLLYLFLTSEMKYEMICRAEGSTVPHLNMSDIRNLGIPSLPSILEQNAIVHILGSLDDKIELNCRMNETLESICLAIFKSWFVDFDPVRAKMEGRKPYGMDEKTAALFPDEFEDSELGKIPKGWELKSLYEITEIIFSGGTPDTRIKEYWNGDYPWLSSGETRNRFITITNKSITQKGIDNSSTKLAMNGDIVIASAGQGNTRGQTSICMIDTYINQSIVALRSKESECSNYYLFINISMRYPELRAISDSHSIRGSLTTKRSTP